MSEPGDKGLFLGIAVTEYDDGNWATLSGALNGVTTLKSLLDNDGYETRMLTNPRREELLEMLNGSGELKSAGFKGPFVLVWSGHGEVMDEALALILRDTPHLDPGKRNGAYRAGELIHFLVESGSNDSVVIIDTCAAGAADAELFIKHLRGLETKTWPGQQPRLACVVSCKAYEQAEDGAFLAELIELLTEGPGDVDLGAHALVWGPSSDAVPLPSVFHAIEKRARRDTHPRTWSAGSSDISFPNPGFDPKSQPALVDDRIRQVRGEPPQPPGLVETPAAGLLLERIVSGAPGLWVLTGGPGVGKSSCLGYVAETTNIDFVLLQARLGVEHLAGAVAVEKPLTAVALDALDEVPARERAGIVELATGWSRTRFVTVSTRTETAFDESGRAAAERLIAGAARTIDLGDPRWQGDAIARYVAERLRRETDES